MKKALIALACVLVVLQIFIWMFLIFRRIPDNAETVHIKDNVSHSTFRGNRIEDSGRQFKLVMVNVENLQNSKNMALEFFFNQPLDPKTVNSKSIFLNGRPLSDEADMLFNHNGTKLTVLTEKEYDTFCITLYDIKSFHASVLSDSEVKELNLATRFRILDEESGKYLEERKNHFMEEKGK